METGIFFFTRKMGFGSVGLGKTNKNCVITLLNEYITAIAIGIETLCNTLSYILTCLISSRCNITEESYNFL